MNATRINTGVYLKKDLIDQLDAYRGELSRSRSIELILKEKFREQLILEEL